MPRKPKSPPPALPAISPAQYAFVCSQILQARKYGLEGTGDLVNYCCVALAYGDAFDMLPEVAALLEQVRSKTLSFDQLMQHFPHDIPPLAMEHRWSIYPNCRNENET